MEISEKDEKKIIKLIRKAFKYLNGKINPRYKAYKLIIHDEMNIALKGIYFPYSATCTGGVVKIYLNDIIESFYPDSSYRRKIDIDELKGYIIGVVAHELSHVDQDIPAYGTDEQMAEVEISNEKNTIAFINKYKDELVSEFGYFNIHEYESRSVYLDMSSKYPNARYRKISSAPVKLWNMLNTLSTLDVKKYLEDHPELNHVNLVVNNKLYDDQSILNIKVADLSEPESWKTYKFTDFALKWITDHVMDSCSWETKIFIPEHEDFKDILCISLTYLKTLDSVNRINGYQANVTYFSSIGNTDEILDKYYCGLNNYKKC